MRFRFRPTFSSSFRKFISLKTFIDLGADIVTAERLFLQSELFQAIKDKSNMEIELALLKVSKARIEAKLLFQESLFSVIALMERMEAQIGRPKLPRKERWEAFFQEREGTELITNISNCFTKLNSAYSAKEAALQLCSLYSSLSTSIHNFDTLNTGLDEYVLSVPPATTDLQLCIIGLIISSPQALGYPQVKFMTNTNISA